MAGPDPPLVHRRRRAGAAGAGGLAARRDLQSRDLREGHPGLLGLRRADRAPRARGPQPALDLPVHRDRGRGRGGGRPAGSAPLARRQRRLRLAGGRPRPRLRHRAHARPGAGVLRAIGPPQRDDQDPGHGGRLPGDRAGDLRGHPRQRDPAVQRRGLRRGRRGVHPRPGAQARGRAGPRRALGGVVLRLAGGHRGGQAPGDPRPPGAQGSGGPGERAGRVPPLRGDLPR